MSTLKQQITAIINNNLVSFSNKYSLIYSKDADVKDLVTYGVVHNKSIILHGEYDSDNVHLVSFKSDAREFLYEIMPQIEGTNLFTTAFKEFIEDNINLLKGRQGNE